MCGRPPAVALARMPTFHDKPGTPGGMGGRSPPAARHRLGRGRARPRGARAVRGQGAFGRGLGGSGLGVRGGSPRDRVAFPWAGNVCAVRGRGRQARRHRRSADARRAQWCAVGAAWRRCRERRAPAAAGRHRLARPQHRDRHRARGCTAVGDGRGGRTAEGSPRRGCPAPGSPFASPARPPCGPTSTTPTRPR